MTAPSVVGMSLPWSTGTRAPGGAPESRNQSDFWSWSLFLEGDTAQEDLGWGRSFLGSRDGSGHMSSPKPERRWMSDEVFRGQRPPMSQATGQGDHSLHALSMPGLWRDVGAELSDIPQFQGARQNTWLPHRLNFFLCLSRSLLCIQRAPGFIRGWDRVIGSQLEYTHFCLCQIY